jgi:hypothetical protein
MSTSVYINVLSFDVDILSYTAERMR